MFETLFLTMFLGKALWLWLSFLAIIILLLVLDLGLFHKDQHEIGVRESLLLSGFYILVGLAFGLWIWFELGQTSALEYYTGYVIEKSLSMDNIFVMAIIFGALHIPRKYQHRVLFWGILGVIIMRGAMIIAGAALVHRFEWVLYLFAAFLVFTGFKLLFMKEDEKDAEKTVENNPVLVFLRKHFRVTESLHGQKFLIKQPSPRTGKNIYYITPLLLALVTIECADVIFAVDSVPAIFAITTDTYIVFTSNVFAILGLRALYFALSAMIERFAYLKYALALILIFIGGKVFVTDMLGLTKFPASISLGVTLTILAAGVLFSLYKTRNLPPVDLDAPPPAV